MTEKIINFFSFEKGETKVELMRNLREVSEKEGFIHPAKTDCFSFQMEKEKKIKSLLSTRQFRYRSCLCRRRTSKIHIYFVWGNRCCCRWNYGRRNGTRRCDKVFGQISWKKSQTLFFKGGGFEFLALLAKPLPSSKRTKSQHP